MKKFIIEARINEYAMRDGNRHVPWTPEEIADTAAQCREAGAAIVHFHARQPDGSPEFGYDSHRETIARIRERCDILIYPTLGAHDRQATPADRIAHILRLAREGHAPDFAPMDMGSTNVDRFDAASGWFISEERVYANSISTLRYFAESLREAGVRPQLVNWNLPMLRTSAAFMGKGLVECPAWIYLGLSAASLSHHPPTPEGLAAFLPFIPKEFPVEWTVALTGGSLLPFMKQIVLEGGHASTGLGDHPYRELGEPTNADVVRQLVKMAREWGREAATPDEARAMLGMRKERA